jgi:hypothetical protein
LMDSHLVIPAVVVTSANVKMGKPSANMNVGVSSSVVVVVPPPGELVSGWTLFDEGLW